MSGVKRRLRVVRTRPAISSAMRWQVFARDGFRCRYCGSGPTTAPLVIDHQHPLSLGDGNEIDNLVTACEPCNAGKSDAIYTAEACCPTNLVIQVVDLIKHGISARELLAAAGQAESDWAILNEAIDGFWERIVAEDQREVHGS